MRALLMVVSVMSCACATTGATPRPFPMPGSGPAETRPDPRAESAAPAPPLPIRAGGYEISGTALSLRGRPYRTGGADPAGFDCSGLVRYVFAQHGLSVPRTVAEQFRAGGEVSDLKPGDLVFFTTTSPDASHVGIVVGGDSFVHAPATSGVVRVDRIGDRYWASRYVGARRVQ